MREIIFRGKRIDNGEWVYGSPVFYQNGTAVICKEGQRNESIDPLTIGQYTGLLDKNGKKIFEGDIVEFEDAHADCYGYHDNIFINTSDIIYSNGGFSIHGTQVVTMDDLVYKGEFDGNVIGNIHDNPELKAMIFTAN